MLLNDQALRAIQFARPYADCLCSKSRIYSPTAGSQRLHADIDLCRWLNPSSDWSKLENSKDWTYQNLAECFNDDATAILSFVVRAAA